MKIMFAAPLASAMLLACTGVASASGVAIEANGARAQQRWGGELGIGYTVDIGPLRLRPIGGAFIHEGDNDRYERDRFSNGDSRCRDTQTGRFASDSDCVNIAVRWYAKAEAVFAIPAGPEVGGGARFSSDRVRPYGTIAFSAGNVRIKGNAGDRYFALGVMLQL